MPGTDSEHSLNDIENKPDNRVAQGLKIVGSFYAQVPQYKRIMQVYVEKKYVVLNRVWHVGRSQESLLRRRGRTERG